MNAGDVMTVFNAGVGLGAACVAGVWAMVEVWRWGRRL